MNIQYNKGKSIVVLLLILAVSLPAAGNGESAAETRADTAVPDAPPIDRREYETLKTAVFAMGCFWGPDARFGQLSGVVRTRVGYAGGTTSNPTYHSIGDHSEAIEITYDPSIITYNDLLQLFWASHSPTSKPYSRQYMSLILYVNEEQQRLAEDSRNAQQRGIDDAIYTEIVPLEQFYQAEDYHQKYGLKGNPGILGELRRYYPAAQGITDSTAAARINGYLNGHGTREELLAEIDSFGLTKAGKEQLLRRAR